MTTPATEKRQKLNAMINSKSWSEQTISQFFEKTNRRRLWAHDLVGLSDLLEQRRSELEPRLGRHVFSSIHHAFKTAEAELSQTEEHLALAAPRSRVRPILGMAIPTLAQAELPTEVFPPAVWIVLAELAILMEDLTTYMQFRSKGLHGYRATYEARAKGAAPNKAQWFNFIRLVGEAGDTEMLKHLDSNRPANLTAQDENICDSAFLYAGNVSEYRRRAQRRFSEQEQAFADFVKDKSIAMVGPVDVGLENGAEIDNYDLVMRFNFLGMGTMSEAAFGSRTDFSFYVENKLPRAISNPENQATLNSLKWIVADYTHRPNDACFTGVDTPVRRRFPAGHPFANPLFKGTHNAIQRAVADLARFDTGNIKVFNSDLFISAEYAPGYRSTSSEILCMGFTTHDPVSNFHFTRRMQEIGVIAADERLTEILANSAEEYARQLHLRYGQAGLGLNSPADADDQGHPSRPASSKQAPSKELPGSNDPSMTLGKQESTGKSGIDEAPKTSPLPKPLSTDQHIAPQLSPHTTSPIDQKCAGFVELDIRERPEEILRQARGKSFVHIVHNDQPNNQNIIEISRKDQQTKQLLVALANAGFSHYKCKDQVSSFVFRSRIPTLWKPVVDGEFLHHDGIVYDVTMPAEDMPARRLIVVFSSIAEKMYESSLSRMFFKNFKRISKYLPPDTAVLRIADIGSVVGSFYIGNKFDPDNASRVQAVVKKVQTDLGIVQDSVILYGASKGGTGALYHALLGNFNAVSVDPITADELYVRKYKDSHFTMGTFPADKSEIFAELTNRCQLPTASISVITSPRSPQFPYINSVIKSSPVGHALNYVEADNPRISDHPDVGPSTIHILTMLLNMAFYGMHFTQPNIRRSV